MSEAEFEYKKKYSCSICELLLEDPVYLPCSCICVCRKHLKDSSVVKNGIIDCTKCTDRFFVSSFKFKTNESTKLLMENDAILAPDEKKSKASILERIQRRHQLHEKLIAEQNAFEVFSYDHFQEICRQIYLQEEVLKIKSMDQSTKISQISDDMIKRSQKWQRSYQQKRDQLAIVALFNLDDEKRSLNDRFRNIELTSEGIDQLKLEQEQHIDDIHLKLSQFSQLKEQVTSCTFVPNLDFDQDNFGSLWLHGANQRVVTSSYLDRSIKMWDIESGECLKTLSCPKVNTIIKLPKNQLASGSADGFVNIWDLCSGKCVRTIHVGESEIRDLKLISEEEIAFVSGDKEIEIKIWNFEDGSCVNTLKGHTEGIPCLVLLKNRILASGSWDMSIKLWNLIDGSCIRTLIGHGYLACDLVSGGVMCLHELRNGQLVSGSGDKTIKLWNTSTGECLSTLIGHSCHVKCLDSTENGQLISSSADETIKVWNTLTGECLRTIVVVGNDEEILCLKYFKDGIFFTGSWNGKLKCWNTNKDVCTKTIDAHEEMIDGLILV